MSVTAVAGKTDSGRLFFPVEFLRAVEQSETEAGPGWIPCYVQAQPHNHALYEIGAAIAVLAQLMPIGGSEPLLRFDAAAFGKTLSIEDARLKCAMVPTDVFVLVAASVCSCWAFADSAANRDMLDVRLGTAVVDALLEAYTRAVAAAPSRRGRMVLQIMVKRCIAARVLRVPEAPTTAARDDPLETFDSWLAGRRPVPPIASWQLFADPMRPIHGSMQCHLWDVDAARVVFRVPIVAELIKTLTRVCPVSALTVPRLRRIIGTWNEAQRQNVQKKRRVVEIVNA